MGGYDADTPLLDHTRAAFIQGRVSMNVASCSAEGVPSLARAYGCRVSADRRRITVFLPVAYSPLLFADLRAGRAVAVVFSRPSTHETLQLKGRACVVAPLMPGDRELMAAYAHGFRDEIRSIGFCDPFVTAMVAAADSEAVSATFTPDAAFVQTPGPDAGRRLEPRP